MDPNFGAFPHRWTEDTQEVSGGITYRQWMIGKVASGVLANPNVQIQLVTEGCEPKWEIIGQILEIADGLMSLENDQPFKD